MDEPIPIEGIVEGDPEALAAVCAAGGSAVLAYCATVGAKADVHETVIAALAALRRGIVANADQEPSELQHLLLSVTDDAVRRVAGVLPSSPQRAAAQVALEGAATEPLPPGLPPRIIRALVDAAPVTAIDGDAEAICRAAEQHYNRVFDGQGAPSTPHPAATTPPTAPEPASPAPMAPPAPAPTLPPIVPTPASGTIGWVPPELAGLDVEALNARSVTPTGHGATALAAPAHAPAAAADTPASAQLAVSPPAPPPGALVIKRGGHWPFGPQQRKPSPRGSGTGATSRGRYLSLALAVLAGVALGAGGAVLVMPEQKVERNSILVRLLDTPFTVSGAVFNVARTATATWALDIRRRPTRNRHTWLTLAAQTRNISHDDFRPRALGYRLRTISGVVIGPETVRVPSSITAARGVLPTGERSSVHLGFQIPNGQRGLTLEFDVTPDGPRVRVPLN